MLLSQEDFVLFGRLVICESIFGVEKRKIFVKRYRQKCNKYYNVVWGLISNKKLVSMHTILNKVTGFLLFLLPLTLSFIEPIYSSVVVCFVATVAAINEVYHTRMGKEIV